VKTFTMSGCPKGLIWSLVRVGRGDLAGGSVLASSLVGGLGLLSKAASISLGVGACLKPISKSEAGSAAGLPWSLQAEGESPTGVAFVLPSLIRRGCL